MWNLLSQLQQRIGHTGIKGMSLNCEPTHHAMPIPAIAGSLGQRNLVKVYATMAGKAVLTHSARVEPSHQRHMHPVVI